MLKKYKRFIGWEVIPSLPNIGLSKLIDVRQISNDGKPKYLAYLENGVVCDFGLLRDTEKRWLDEIELPDVIALPSPEG